MSDFFLSQECVRGLSDEARLREQERQWLEALLLFTGAKKATLLDYPYYSEQRIVDECGRTLAYRGKLHREWDIITDTPLLHDYADRGFDS